MNYTFVLDLDYDTAAGTTALRASLEADIRDAMQSLALDDSLLTGLWITRGSVAVTTQAPEPFVAHLSALVDQGLLVVTVGGVPVPATAAQATIRLGLDRPLTSVNGTTAEIAHAAEVTLLQTVARAGGASASASYVFVSFDPLVVDLTAPKRVIDAITALVRAAEVCTTAGSLACVRRED